MRTGYNVAMERKTIDMLNSLNKRFYQNNHASFDQTRQNAWIGWGRVTGHMECKASGRPARLLDIACGNMRFEKHLAESASTIALHATCIDSCDELAVPMEWCDYRHDDVVGRLSNDESPIDCWGDGYDAVVSFGFFHHVPGFELRCRLLGWLVDSAAPGGLVAVSLWRFADDERKREKAAKTTAEGITALELPNDLEDGDYLLGWNDEPGVLRYCHSFSDREIDALVSRASCDTVLVDRFRADGRTNDMNEYLVLRRK